MTLVHRTTTSISTWTKNHSPVREYWRRREAGWRALGIKSRLTDEAFNRYDYRKLWLAQKGLCGVCDRELKTTRWEDAGGLGLVGVGQGIDVDHGHTHGYARALVHGRCNRMVGVMRSHDALLVLNYLIRHEGADAETVDFARGLVEPNEARERCG